jgi:hypothetical protein
VVTLKDPQNCSDVLTTKEDADPQYYQRKTLVRTSMEHPQLSKYITYNEYLKHKHWSNFKKKIMSDHNTTCELCGKRRYQIRSKKIANKFTVHHKHYRSLWHESRDDVMILCWSCHDICHKILARKQIDDSLPFLYNIKDTIKKYFKYTPRKPGKIKVVPEHTDLL